MTMHLCGPALTTTGKKRGKFKFRNAEQARQARELDLSWKDLLQRQGVEQQERKRRKAMAAEPLVYKLETPVGRTNTKHIPSRGDGTGNATLSAPKVYTGVECIGIGQLHKSNGIPIFRKQDAEDLAKMRR